MYFFFFFICYYAQTLFLLLILHQNLILYFLKILMPAYRILELLSRHLLHPNSV